MTAITQFFPERAHWRTVTVRQSTLALGWAVGFVVVATVWLFIEKYGLDLPSRHRAALFLPTISIGIPHILIGFVFALASSRMKARFAYGKMAGLLVLGVAGCWLFNAVGGARAPSQLGPVLVSFYFIVHLLRDQRFFYLVHGDAPEEDEARSDTAFLKALQTLILIGVGGLAVVGLDVHAQWRRGAVAPMDYIFGSSVPLVWRVLLVAGLCVLLFVLRYRSWKRSSPLGFSEMLRRHQPIVATLVLFFALLVCSFTGDALFRAFVLWHVIEWFIFATRGITASEQPATGPRSLWYRIRRTRRGFVALHVGGALVVFATILIWTYGFGKAGPLVWVVGADSFYYWTIMHVTVSFHH